MAAVLGLLVTALSGCGSEGSSTGTGTTGSTSSLIAPGLTPFNNITRQASSAACTANAHVAGRARWTVLVYMDGASNLQDDTNINVGQMASVGSDGTNVNIVVQWKQAASNPYFTSASISPTAGDTPAFDGTRRYYIKPHSAADVSVIEGPTSTGAGGSTGPLDNAGERLPDPATNGMYNAAANTSDMGNYKVLQDFVQWGAATYPADHLLVVIWDHGSAALSITSNKSVKTAVSKAITNLKTLTKAATAPRPLPKRSVCFDTNTGSQITTEQLPLAFAYLGGTTSYGATQKCDVITVDCSLEGTTEVAYQLSSSARVYTGSEESPPGQGLAYDAWLAALKAGGANPCAVGSSIVSTFVNSPLYAGNATYQQSLTNSMIDLTQMQNLITALNAFGASLLQYEPTFAAQIASARDTAQQYDLPYYADYKDLYDFADNIRTASVPTALQTAASNLETAMVSATSGAILASAHGTGTVQQFSTGLSIYCPSPVANTSGYSGGPPSTEYFQLAISQTSAAPQWYAFLQAQTQ
jgi:hypothetical protein